MRFMVMIKATPQTEAGQMPGEDVLAAMGRYNEELANAGVLLGGEGARVRFEGERCSVIDGPFAETKELVAGFWLWQVKSMEEAVEWVKRCPNPMPGDSDIEIRPLFEAEDFSPAFTDALQAQKARLSAQAEAGKHM